MIGGFDDLPVKVQAWLLTFFSSPEEVDRWLRRPDKSCGCAPIQLLEAPPGLPALEDLIRAQRRAAASDDAAGCRRSVGRDKQAG
jgi:hypothetical protein